MKAWWKSRTIWFNVLTALAVVLTEVAAIPGFEDAARWLLLGAAVVNLVLRTITTQPIGGGGS